MSCIMLSFVLASFSLLEDGFIARNRRPCSRRRVVRSLSIVDEFCAFQLSGYNVCGTIPYFATRLTIMSVEAGGTRGQQMGTLDRVIA